MRDASVPRESSTAFRLDREKSSINVGYTREAVRRQVERERTQDKMHRRVRSEMNDRTKYEQSDYMEARKVYCF